MVVFTKLETILIITLLILFLTTLLILIIRLIYTTIYPHKCRIRYKRRDNVQIKDSRFRIKYDKDRGWRLITPGTKRKRIDIEKPDEDYFEIINKKKLYAEIIIPENGEAYCIKPNISKLGENVEYSIYNRNVLNALKQELKADINLYQWKSGLRELMNMVIVFLIIASVVLGLYFNNKIVKESIEASKSNAEVMREGMKYLGDAISNFSMSTNNYTGSIHNPIILNQGG